MWRGFTKQLTGQISGVSQLDYNLPIKHEHCLNEILGLGSFDTRACILGSSLSVSSKMAGELYKLCRLDRGSALGVSESLENVLDTGYVVYA